MDPDRFDGAEPAEPVVIELDASKRDQRRFSSRGFMAVASVLVITLGLVVGPGILRPSTPAVTSMPGGSAMPAAGDAKFAFLATQHSNFCSLQPDMVMGYSDDTQLQGSCCSPMNRDAYVAQTTGLRRFATIPEVPQDPYDISAGQAKKLLDFDRTISLDAAQQETYDGAMKMTHDKGPCCCQCWRWYMTEGLAKFLIAKHSMAAQDVATTVDLVNGCGGPRGMAAIIREVARSPV